MFVHSVYFSLKSDVTADERAALTRDIQTLRDIPMVRACCIGAPTDADRPAFDRNYDLGLILLFDNQADEEAYIAHPLHRAFADKWRERWTVRIFDCVEP